MPTSFVDPPHSPYAWSNAPSTNSPLDKAHLEAAEQDIISYAQQGDLAVVNYFEGGSSASVPTGPAFGKTFVKAPSGDTSGVTDTANINSARDTAGINSTLQFRAGTYWVKGLTASVANQLWQLPIGCTLILVAAQNTPIITINANNIRIEGPGAIDGNSANNTGSSTLGIFFSGPTTNCAIRWLTIQNCYAGGMLVYTGSVTIQSCRFTNIVNGTGIYAQPGSTADVVDIHILDNRMDKTTSTSGYGIQIHGAPGTPNYYQRRLIIRGNLIGLPSSPGTTRIGIETWGGCPGATITGNKIYGGTMGISADRCDVATITTNEIYGPTSNGIEVAGCIGATISANTIDGNAVLGSGIVLDGTIPGGSSKCTITGNTIRNLNTGGNAKYMYVIGGDHNVWGDNTTYVTATAGASGLYCQNSPHNSIGENNFFGNGTALYAVTFDGVTSSGILLGNLFDGWSTLNVALYSASVGTLDNITIGLNRHINGSVGALVGSASYGANVQITPATPISKPAYAATITPDSHQAKTWRPGVLTANVTIGAPTTANAHQGQELWIILQQDATGGRTITWNAAFVNTPTTNTAANAYTVARFVHDGTSWIGI